MDSASTGKTGNNTIKVAVWMITYNHALYIEEAIESVLKQKCEFNTHLFIGVDCSTDRTLEICMKYERQFPDKITVLDTLHRIGAPANSMRTYTRCIESGAEYMALLEGDDYWTDENKLEKQVAIMDRTPTANVVCSSYWIGQDGKRELSHLDCDSDNEYGYCIFDNQSNMSQWFTKTCTSMIRVSAIPLANIMRYKNIFDYHLMYEALRSGNGIYMKRQPTAFYRAHASGIWAQRPAAEKTRGTYLVHKELAVLYPEDLFVRDQFITKTRHFIESHADNRVPITPLALLAPFRLFLLTKDTKRALRLYKRIIVDFVIKSRLLGAG